MSKTRITTALISDEEVGTGLSRHYMDAFEASMDPATASLARMRAEVHRALRLRLVALPGTQTEKARALGIKQPRLNKLLSSTEPESFSLDNLMLLASRAGLIASLNIKARRRAHQTAHG